MVSADNLNLDCLELIFAYLTGNDLSSVGLVSKSFLAGVVPYLYRRLVFHLGNAKRYPTTLTPFDTIITHPSLAIHVHAIDIRTVPSRNGIPHAQFMKNVMGSMKLCSNLREFTCIPNILPSLLLPLKERPNLQSLRANATLTPQQVNILSSITTLKSLSLDECSWNMVDALPKWTRSMSATLTTLVLHTIKELNDCILETMLPHLPNLTVLGVVGCVKVEHGTTLQATRHTPKLESLAFTAWDSAPLPAYLAELPFLRHITIDTQIGPMGNGHQHTDTPALWTAMFELTRMWHSPLRSIILRLSDKTSVSLTFIKALLAAHGPVLEHIAFINVEVPYECIRSIAKKCPRLDRLALHIPTKDLGYLTDMLAHSKTIRILTDVGETHASHSTQAFASRTNVTTMMKAIPSLEKLVMFDRIWTRDKSNNWQSQPMKLKPERRKNSCPPHWFLPR